MSKKTRANKTKLRKTKANKRKVDKIFPKLENKPKPKRGYAIKLPCICGKDYFSEGNCMLHKCLNCGHVWDLHPHIKPGMKGYENKKF